jgi:uncharacterized protein YjbI with pentapeptide repeats
MFVGRDHCGSGIDDLIAGFALGIAVATAVAAGTVVVGSATPTWRISFIDGAQLADADLNGAILRGIYTVVGVGSGGITGVPASLPDGVLGAASLVDGYLVGPDVDLNGADLASADLKGVSFQRATLDNADLADADLTGASIDGYLAGANLSGTNLTDAYMAGVSSGGIIGTPAILPSNWLLEDGYLIGPDAQVTQANLTGVSLAGADLQVINLDGANLSGANASDAYLAAARLAGAVLDSIQSDGGVTGGPASLPSGWVLRSGWLIGPDVTLDNPADFTKADLRGADLFGADLNSDTWTDATCPDGTSATSHGGTCMNALAFRFAGFITPKPGSTVAASTKRVIVHFKLATASGAAIPASAASAIAAAKEVRVTLAGRGVSATSAYCSWDSAVGEFACTITVAEKPGASFQTAPRLGTAANPGTIHFG